MKCVRHILSGLAVASMSIAAHAASFDCIKAQSEVERMICGSADLSGLDDQLGKAWTQHLRNNAFKDQFRRTQRRWIEQRNQCKDAACLRQAYLARLEQMTSGKEYFLREGEDQPLCERVVRALNAELYRPGRGRVCAFDILQRLPGVQLPPWQKLDLHKDKELYKRFILAGYVGQELWSAAFADPPPKAGQIIDATSKRPLLTMPTDDLLNKEWQWAVEHGDEFYRWDKAIPFPEQGNVLLVRIASPNGGSCPSIDVKLFTRDLKEPVAVINYSLFSMVPFLVDQKWHWLVDRTQSESISSSPEIHRFELPIPNLTPEPRYHAYLCRVDSMNKHLTSD